MRKSVAMGAIAALGLAAPAFAAEGFSYNLIEGGYVSSELDVGPGTADGDGFTLSGSTELGESIFGFAGYTSTDLEGLTLSQFSLGAGFHWPLNPLLDLVSGVSYERLKLEDLGSDGGFGLNVGLRGRPMPQLELAGGIKYVDFGNDADDMVFSIGGRWYFTEQFAIGLDYSRQDDLDLSHWGFSLRYDFGSRF